MYLLESYMGLLLHALWWEVGFFFKCKIQNLMIDNDATKIYLWCKKDVSQITFTTTNRLGIKTNTTRL